LKIKKKNLNFFEYISFFFEVILSLWKNIGDEEDESDDSDANEE
jgi:hypothetical protein